MTTFTMQDLTAQPQQENNMTPTEIILDHLNAPEVPKETKEVLHNLLESRGIPNPEPVTKEQWMEYGMNNIRLPNPDAIQYTQGGTLGAPEPQPSDEIDPIKLIDEMMTQFSIKLKLLATVISQSKAQPTQGNSLNAGENSLQECVSLTLQQADWFKDLIRHELIGGGIEDLAKDAVQDVVESEVESYFENNFDPSYHFDFDDAVSDAVDDRIDNIVSDKIDDAVESYLAEATITISK